jgi:hypothetical protein
LIDYVAKLCYNRHPALNNYMTDQPKKFTDALKDALSQKQAAAHPDVKGRKGKDGKSRKSGTPMIGGRPVQRTVGRGG